MDWRITAVATGALFLSTGRSAAAFELKTTSRGAPVHWRHGLVNVDVVETGGPGDDVLLLRAVRGAATTWRASAAIGIDVTPGGAAANDSDLSNGAVVRFATDEWPFDSRLVARTSMVWAQMSGEVLGAEVLINGVDFDWVDRMSPGAHGECFDLQNVMTHEFGHVLGIAHSSVEQATMFSNTHPRDVQKRVLDVDDIEAARRIYDELIRSDGVGCSHAGAPGAQNLVGLLQWSTFVIALGWVRRTRCT